MCIIFLRINRKNPKKIRKIKARFQQNLYVNMYIYFNILSTYEQTVKFYNFRRKNVIKKIVSN